MVQKKLDGMVRAERGKYLGSLEGTIDPQGSEGDEPEEHNGTEPSPEPSSSVWLDGKERKQYGDGDRQRIRLIGGCLDLDAFYGAQDRNGRCDDPIAVD